MFIFYIFNLLNKRILNKGLTSFGTEFGFEQSLKGMQMNVVVVVVVDTYRNKLVPCLVTRAGAGWSNPCILLLVYIYFFSSSFFNT